MTQSGRARTHRDRTPILFASCWSHLFGFTSDSFQSPRYRLVGCSGLDRIRIQSMR